MKCSPNRRERSRRWLEAAIALASDPYAAVHCPECRQSHLAVQDETWEEDPFHFERYMICRVCGSWNMFRMRREEPDE